MTDNDTAIILNSMASPEPADENQEKQSSSNSSANSDTSSLNKSTLPENELGTAVLERDPANKPAEKTEAEGSKTSKKAGNRNALCHGVYASDVILPWESETEYEQMHASFKDEWKPVGASEEQAVLDLTHWTWTKWRAAKMAQIHYYSDPLISDLLKSEKRSWEEIREFRRTLPELADSNRDLANQLIEAMNGLLDDIRKRPYSTDTSDGKKAQLELAKLTNDVNVFIDDTKRMLLSNVDGLAKGTARVPAIFDLAYKPETMEQETRVMAFIEGRIDKILRRLTALKEYKRIAASQSRPPTLIEGPLEIPAKA